MVFSRPYFLDDERLAQVLACFEDKRLLVTYITYKNKIEQKHIKEVVTEVFKRDILDSLESGFGSDFWVRVPGKDFVLQGHHDGVYWLKDLLGNKIDVSKLVL